MSLDRGTLINPNQISPRSAMGLPNALVDRLGAEALMRNSDLLSHCATALVETLESPVAALDRRYAAGAVLAFIGDPRIRPLMPQMIRQPGARVTLGLAPERAESVAAAWRHVGVTPEWIRKECPQYVANIAPFGLGRFPVTHFEFRLFLEDTGSQWLPTSWTLGTYPAHLANHPVWTVPPEAADAYVAWLSERTERRFRLPTEVEWEYAASVGDGREFPWGSSFEPQRANTVESGPLSTTPVGMYPLGRTATGIDDMAGNVEEYTGDEYRAYPGGTPIFDDLYSVRGNYRVARGGSFARYGDLARCQRRHGWFERPIYAMGFRVAESL